MLPHISEKLLELNKKFYLDFGKAFSHTRQRLQPGVERIINQLPAIGRWLDIGCGNGSLAVALAAGGKSGVYIGIDYSSPLLDEARKAVSVSHHSEISLRFLQLDISQENWSSMLEEKLEEGGFMKADELFSSIFAFALLHHIPGSANCQKLLCQLRRLLPVNGLFIFSVWQPQKSKRLQSRMLPWETVGLAGEDVEPGDVLIDWRYALPDQQEQSGIRYVHVFTTEELDALAASSGFSIEGEFESDGEGGMLGLYQQWRAV